ncbi:MAG: nuclear transport factor 2 family protein [Pseudomonadota bacterium]
MTLAVLAQFDPNHLVETGDVFAEDVVFHYYNPQLPDLHGDYVGRDGIQAFFEKLAQLTGHAFEVNLVSATAVGDELVVIHRKQGMIVEDRRIAIDVVVVWRFVDGLISEVWDIPSLHAVQVLDE